MSQFKSTFTDSLLQLLSSKKGIAFIVGLLLVILNSLGVMIPEENLTELVGLIIAYILGQGVADAGKEATKIQHSSRSAL